MRSWRKRYRVWLQARGTPLSGAGNEYAAECLDCTPEEQGRRSRDGLIPWLTDTCGSGKEAWDVCREHERRTHKEEEG